MLAEQIAPSIQNQDVVVLALPRGGVPVGFEISQKWNTDLDIFVVRKLGVPGQEELAMGAVASGGVRVLNDATIRELRISQGEIERATEREKQEIARREAAYREGRPALNIQGRTAVLVDDGLATGATMLAAAKAVRRRSAARIVVAVPVASREACEEFRSHVDEVVCAAMPRPFYAVGLWYEDFSQTSDAEVRQLLEQAAGQRVT